MEGQTVSHYQILKKVGEGGMGRVYLAQDTRLKRRVALKFLSERLSADAQAFGRFKREALACSALNDPHICVIHDIGEVGSQPFIVMEFLDGQTLRVRIEKGRLDTQELLDLGVQISRGLETAHQKGIVHRDIKPANIFVTNQSLVKILDFGLATLVETQEEVETATTVSRETPEFRTAPGKRPGTVGYMSPEQLCGDPFDLRSDVFSLGVVLAEAAAGNRPFRASSVRELLEKILRGRMEVLPSYLPPGFESIVGKCLERQPARRYQHAGEVRVALETLQETLQAERRTRIDETAEMVGLSDEFMISTRRVNDVTILDIRGKLVLRTVEGHQGLQVTVTRLLEQGDKKILFNLEDLNYIDFTAAGQLVHSFREVANQGGEPRLVNPAKQLRVVLQKAKLPSLFECYEDEESAIKSFQHGWFRSPEPGFSNQIKDEDARKRARKNFHKKSK